MKSKLILVAVIATTLATGAFVYADSHTNSGTTSTGTGRGLGHHFGQGPDMRGHHFGQGPDMRGPHMRGPDMMRPPRPELTQDEITKLQAMTDSEKKTFIEAKIAEQKAKMEARENVIDKLLNGDALTAEEKVIQAEIKKAREEQKAKRAEMEAKIAEVKPLLDKLKNGQTLTADEKAKLDSLKIPGPGKGK